MRRIDDFERRRETGLTDSNSPGAGESGDRFEHGRVLGAVRSAPDPG